MLKDYTPNFRKLEELLEALQIKWKLSDKEVDDLRDRILRGEKGLIAWLLSLFGL